MAETKLVKVGKLPGQITEMAVAKGTTIDEVINLAGLDATGFQVKVDGDTVDPSSTFVDSSTELILLVQQVKGN